MDNLDGEIIDLEEDTKKEVSSKNEAPKIAPSNKLASPRLLGSFNNDKTTPAKLQNLNNKNRNIPPVGGSSFNTEQTDVEENEDEKVSQNTEIKQEIKETVKTEVKGTIIEGVKKTPLKYKLIAIATVAVLFLFFVIFASLLGSSDNKALRSNGTSFATGSMNEDELIAELMYYGYCNSESECKGKGIYKFLTKLKKVYEDYSKSCPAILSNDNPCEININTSLLIETINFYQNSGDPYDIFGELTEEEENSLFSKILSFFKKKRQLNQMEEDIEALGLAQSEYVKQTCITEDENGNKKTTISYFYQLSFNKYISYLAYGKTSNHPNYDGKPLEIESCAGPQDDYIPTSYASNSSSSSTNNQNISGSGQGVEIAKYALQFVGNPYVWGGESLTNGCDCSGFTMKVFEHFGITLPHKSDAQASAGGKKIEGNPNELSQALPGDILVWSGHVALYIGNNQVVHASTPETGIIISDASKSGGSHAFIGIYRYWDR